MRDLVDLTFGIHPVARAILNLLSDIKIDYEFPTSITFPYFNGRECGAMILLQKRLSDSVTVVAFGQNRNCDDIFVETWQEDNLPYNILTIENRNEIRAEEAYKNRKYFESQNLVGAVKYIKKLFNV